MRNQLTLAIIMLFCCITTIMGNIKDFIIENENDLKRFGLSPETEQQYDDDVQSEWMYDECGGGGGDGAAAAGDYDYNPYGEYRHDNEVAYGDYDMSQIDPNLLREIVRQLKNDPRFENLWEYLTEENVLMSYGMQENVGDHSDYFLDIDENYGNNEID